MIPKVEVMFGETIMQTESQKKAKAKYDRKTAKGVYLKLNKVTDGDILRKLAEEKNVQGYIKRLIRNDISKGG